MIVFYISGHGFGHASRDIEVINALGRLRPELRIVVRTAAKRWLFDLTVRHPIDFHAADTDPGVIQIDSLRLDEEATIRTAAAFYETFDTRVETEAETLRTLGARLVVGDIPPLAFAAAARAGIPGFALGNFTWDWIYEEYREHAAAVRDLVLTIRKAHATAVEAWRLPMWGGFEGFNRIRDVPFIARRSRRAPQDTRRALRLPDGPLVLLSFGGFGLDGQDPAALPRDPGFGVLTTDGDRSRPPAGASWLFHRDETDLYGRGLRYEDLVAASDVVVTKPGYGIIAECIANETAILYTSRGRFAEYAVLVREMPRFLRCRYVEQEQLLDGGWVRAVGALLAQPPPLEKPSVAGAEHVAELILEGLGA